MNRLKYLFVILITLSSLSCVREDFQCESNDGNYQTVETSLRLMVSDVSNGTPTTKAIQDPSDPSSIEIRNLNILQFDGTDEDSRIVGEVRYLSDEADPNDEEKYLDFSKIRLAESEGQDHTIVIFANLFTKLPQVETLRELKEFKRNFERECDLFSFDGDGKDFPNGDGTTYYQRLNAIVVDKITNGTILKGALRRSMAKLNFNIENTGKDDLVIDSIQVCNVSKTDWYISDYRYIDTDTGENAKLFTEDFKDTYDPSRPKRMDYDKVEWKGNEDGTGTAHYTFYVSSNQRGVFESNLLPQEKNRCPNAAGATNIKIYGRYGKDKDNHVTYTFYLGGNLYNDFNICPNTSYTYNLKFDGKGNHLVDDRIDDMGTVNFDVDANCYILNPPISHTRSYTFNAIHRPNIFWGKRYGLKDRYPNYTIEESEEWKATILWSDFEMTKEEREAFLTRSNGNGRGTYMSDSQRIKVTVPSTWKSGNIVIGLYIDEPSNIIWSWHLWITDYRPDMIAGHAPTDGKYIYQVDGGEVHRYRGEAWENEDGLYRNGYVMDRNLGAYDQKQHSKAHGDGLHYQFGRKDPFHVDGIIYLYRANGDVIESGKFAGMSSTSELLNGLNGSHVPYFVNHPLDIIVDRNPQYWTTNDIFNPPVHDPTIVWQDPYSDIKDENSSNVETLDKSIFDPCPPGWTVPVAEVNPKGYWDVIYKNHWTSRLSGDQQGSATTSTSANCQYLTDPSGKGAGRIYYPLGYLNSKNDPEAPSIFFPATIGTELHLHSSTSYSLGTSIVTELSSNRVLVYDVSSSTKTGLYNIRCIKKSY